MSAEDRRVQDIFYQVMARIPGRSWKSFARERNCGLGLANNQIEDIIDDYSNDVKEQKYQMLSLWKRRKGHAATISNLENLVRHFNSKYPLEDEDRPLPGRIHYADPNTHDIGNDAPVNDVGLHANNYASSDGRHIQQMSSRIGAMVFHQEDSIPARAFTSGDPRNNGAVHEQTATVQAREVNIHSGRSLDQRRPHSSVQENRNLPTMPKAAMNLDSGLPPRNLKAFPDPRVAQHQNFQSNSPHPSHGMSPTDPHMYPSLMNSSNVEVNVMGKNAIGILNNAIYVTTRQEPQVRQQRKEENLHEFCSEVKQIKVSSASKEGFENHLENPESIYRIHNSKGIVLIYNNSFKGTDYQRNGSEFDVKNMKDLWNELGCKVVLKLDLSGDEMYTSLKKFSQSSAASQFDFVAVFIMTHGEQEKGADVFYGADVKSVKVADVLEMFNNKNARKLAGIPKLFFFQFCRGTTVDKGVEVPQDRDETEAFFSSLRDTVEQCSGQQSGIDYSDTKGVQTKKEPTTTDMFVSYATQKGFRAFRNTKGSWYVNAIANVFTKYSGEEHLVDLMTRVNYAVSDRTAINQRDPVVHEGKEMSNFNSTLRKKLYFYPGFPDMEECF